MWEEDIIKDGEWEVCVLFLLQVLSGHSTWGACALPAIVSFVPSFPQNIYSFQPVILPNL